jgi:hypothetical protein
MSSKFMAASAAALSVCAGLALTACEKPKPAAPAKAPRPRFDASLPCRTEDLKLVRFPESEGPGMVTYGLESRGESCKLKGYPKIELIGPDGAVVAVKVTPSSPGYFRKEPAGVVLGPEGRAKFRVEYGADTGAETCRKVARLRVTAPGTEAPTEMAETATVCGDEILVSPVWYDRQPQPYDVPGR